MTLQYYEYQDKISADQQYEEELERGFEDILFKPVEQLYTGLPATLKEKLELLLYDIAEFRLSCKD